MDNNSILNGFQYTFAIMLVLLVLVFWQVYFVHRPKINTLQLEHESGLSCSTVEGMYTSGADVRFLQEPSERFFGGSEPPVFYDIGNIKAARSMRSKTGYDYSTGKGQDGVVQGNAGEYSIVQRDSGKTDAEGKPIMTGVLVKNGVDVDTSYGEAEKKYYYNTGKVVNRRAVWEECPAGQRTSADGYSCYIPEGMYGQRDPIAAAEDSVYGG